MCDIVILGAGLSGLACARSLPDAHIFEAQDHPGGVAYSLCDNGFYFDHGAHICHAMDSEWLNLLYKQTNVEQLNKSCVANYWHGHWMTYPVQNHLFELPLNKRIEALNDLVDALISYRDCVPENYYQWCLFQYGEYLTNNFYSEYTRKYWRVPMDSLSVDWLTGRLLPSQVTRIISGALASQEEGQTAFKKFHYPASGGFFSFFAPMYNDLNVHYEMRAIAVDAQKRTVRFSNGEECSYSTLVSSVPLPELIRMLDDVPSDIAHAGDHLLCTKICCINLVVKRVAVKPWHWFYIYDNDIQVARVSMGSNFTASTEPREYTTMQAEIFRRFDEEMPDEDVVDKTIHQLAVMLGFDVDNDIIYMATCFVPYAYPISDTNRNAAVELITTWLLKERGIYTMGLTGTWTYMWSDAAYRSGVEAAQAILTNQ